MNYTKKYQSIVKHEQQQQQQHKKAINLQTTARQTAQPTNKHTNSMQCNHIGVGVGCYSRGWAEITAGHELLQ